jgi:xanthine/CO dehydrogenase XdhC/CoxF family maturation factor
MSPDAAGTVQAAFDELGRLSFAEHSLESVLQRVTDLATRVLPGQPVTSVTVVERGKPTTAAASGELAFTLDETQYRLGSGPCLSAAATGRPSELLDTQAETDWPEFAAHAAERGCGSVLSFPFPAPERVPGALNVYAHRFSVSDPSTLDSLARFATYAVVPVSNMYLYASAVEKVNHLQTALDSRAVIDQAKGILMERFRLTADQAFHALTRVSMETNTKVRDVADRFVVTGELPTG